MERERGVVSWFDEVKGWGFILPDIPHKGQKDLFVHKSNVQSLDRTLAKGDRVEFELGSGPKGPEAKNVEIIEEG